MEILFVINYLGCRPRGLGRLTGLTRRAQVQGLSSERWALQCSGWSCHLGLPVSYPEEPVWVLVTPLLLQLPANVPERQVDYDSRTWVPATLVGDQMGLLAPGLGLVQTWLLPVQTWLLQPFGEMKKWLQDLSLSFSLTLFLFQINLFQNQSMNFFTF